jgi:hypothetical protein
MRTAGKPIMITIKMRGTTPSELLIMAKTIIRIENTNGNKGEHG